MSAPNEHDELIAALADMVAKCTDYGQQDGGFVAAYILPTGPVHRAIPLLERLGVVVRPGFDGRKPLTDEQRQAVAEYVTEMETEVIPEIIAAQQRRAERWAEIKDRPLFSSCGSSSPSETTTEVDRG